ncbi:hypothetical protein H0H92_006005 [Tricholoma furcatifolium]|nr:hypothetical protein H0H92_006005 [Tricholoma furcatifolium]
MPGEKSSSKKRKHDSISSDGVVVKLATPTAGVGPLLVNYPALQAPLSTPFSCYANKKAKSEAAKAESTKEEDILVVGETEDVEFISNEGETKQVANSGCRYVIAVHNKRTSTLSILPAAKTPHVLTRTVKALKALPALAMSQQEYREARNALGETFGTKKAKASIRAQERNRVDVSAMEGVMSHLQQGIDKGAAGLLTTEAAKEETDKNRLIPPFDASAVDPEDSYPLHNIIPEAEWKALSITAFDQAADQQQRKDLLAFKWSQWLNRHINAAHADVDSPKRRRRNLKILLYISAMLAFRRALDRQKSLSKDELHDKLSAVPGIVVDGLISRFTEISRGSTNHTSTPTTETKLLTFMFALCLKIDNFASDTAQIAHDLNKPVADTNALFKSLGCKIGLLSDRERVQLGLSDKDATAKRAILHAPIVFPKPRLRRK